MGRLPALLYVIQNNLLYYALSHLRATPFKVSYNLKILTSAVFSILLGGQKIDAQRWAALCALFIGVTIVQVGKQEVGIEDMQARAGSGVERTLGFLAVCTAAITSGFSGVYQQRILQGSRTSTWIRNLQMGISSVLLGLMSLAKDWSAIRFNGFFYGYSRIVWLVVVLQAFGGLNVAFILKYADSILKGFAAAFSTLALCLVEMALFDFTPTITFILGSVLINISAYLYNHQIVCKSQDSKREHCEA